jgi:AmiR/NasT family two-component response regulator
VRVLVANEKPEELQALAEAAEALGEQVVARGSSVEDVARLAQAERAELALVGLPHGEDAEHALAMIGELVQDGLCPVMAITENDDPDFVAAAVELGIYAHTTRLDAGLLRAAIDVAVHRFRDHANLKLVMERRTLIERAKGIIMERYGIDERSAFDMLRRHARNSNLRLGVVAEHVLLGYRVLPKEPTHP